MSESVNIQRSERRYSHVFTPLRVGNVELPNRIVRTAHGTGLAGEDLFAYHEARARGGVGLSILQIAGVHANYPTPTMPFTDEIKRIYESLIARTRPHGMRLFQQISHAGSEVPSIAGVEQWSSSAIAGFLIGTTPIAMTRTMIQDIVAGFATAARRAKDSGIDGVEIHAGHGYLVHQFLSPALNRREDEYGGSDENRMRFLSEIIEAVRAEVGRDYAVGVRLAGDDGLAESVGPVQAEAIARWIQEDVDFIDLSLGSHWHFHKMLTSMESPNGYELQVNEPIGRALDVPTIVTGRIMTLAHAESLVSSGVAEMVSMVRALIADPDLVIKERSGRSAQVRPCTGTNQGCIGMFMDKGRIACAVNASAGREAELSELAPFRNDAVLVIGGGIAGMEVARLAALRGSRVELHEANAVLGGQAVIAGAAVARSDFSMLVTWLESEIVRLGVNVHRESRLSIEQVRSVGADLIVVATGSLPDRDVGTMMRPGRPIPGVALTNVFTTWGALAPNRPAALGSRVLVYDDTGSFDALTVALCLLEEGRQVRLVTRFARFGDGLPEPRATVVPSLEVLATGGVLLDTYLTLDHIEDDGASFTSVLSGEPVRFAADSIVVSTYPRPVRQLAELMDAAGIPYRAVGDVTGTHDLTRTIAEAALVLQ